MMCHRGPADLKNLKCLLVYVDKILLNLSVIVGLCNVTKSVPWRVGVLVGMVTISSHSRNSNSYSMRLTICITQSVNPFLPDSLHKIHRSIMEWGVIVILV